MLSHAAGGFLTFFRAGDRKKWSLGAENTHFVRACVLSEIDAMALIPPSVEKSSKFSMGNPSADLPVGSMLAGARGKAGKVSKKSKPPFASVRHGR